MDEIRFILINMHSELQNTSRIKPNKDLSDKFDNGSDKDPIMDHFVTEMNTYVHISSSKWCIVGNGTVALWYLCCVLLSMGSGSFYPPPSTWWKTWRIYDCFMAYVQP